MTNYRTFGYLIGSMAAGLALLVAATPAPAACPSLSVKPGSANLAPVQVLSQLDIDGDGLPDNQPDSDGDGLPDNWEANPDPGQNDTRFVNFSAPTGISPGTPATFVSVRLIVTSDECDWDTDGDGLSDFIEVFGLKYIDDNGNGKLDFVFDDANNNGRYDPGETIDPVSEWMDFNGDGLPSIGEHPIANIDEALFRNHDYDGFMFTDPRSRDTDADGVDDGLDGDPLINPETFGLPNEQSQGFFRLEITDRVDLDLDNDGLGDLTDFGNDLTSIVDYPQGFADLVDLFRPDRLACATPTIPESLLEDLLGADWNGDGLFRITDVRDFRTGVPNANAVSSGNPCGFGNRFAELFQVGSFVLFGQDPTLSGSACEFPSGGVKCTEATPYAARNRHLGWQKLLLPSAASDPFFPDVRIWTILYAWRAPGFDIDGNGYIGSPESSFDLDDLHPFVTTSTGGGGGTPTVPQLDGVIQVPQCAGIGIAGAGGTLLAFVVAIVSRPLRRGRQSRTRQ